MEVDGDNEADADDEGEDGHGSPEESGDDSEGPEEGEAPTSGLWLLTCPAMSLQQGLSGIGRHDYEEMDRQFVGCDSKGAPVQSLDGPSLTVFGATTFTMQTVEFGTNLCYRRPIRDGW